MASIIDLAHGLNEFEFQQSNSGHRRLSTQITSAKVKKFMADFVYSLTKTNKNHQFEIYKNCNQFQVHTEMPPFHEIYSFLSKISFKKQSKCFNFQNLLLCKGKPFTIQTLSLRLSSIYFLNYVHRQLPGFKICLNTNNGLISVTNYVAVYEQIVNQLQIYQSVINNMIQSVTKNSQIFVKVFSKISNNFQVFNKKVNIQQSNNQDSIRTILKYLGICFLQLDISDVELERKKILSNPQLTQRTRFSNNIPLDISLFQIDRVLNLFQVCKYSVNKIQDTIIDQQQITDFSVYLRTPKPKINNDSDNQFIFNEIYIKGTENISMVGLNMKGGTAQFALTKVKFNYVTAPKFSKQQKIILTVDPPQIYMQKFLIIKNPINKQSQKYITHQQKIISLMRFSTSAYMIKYYKTQQKCILQNKLMMDYNPNIFDLSMYLQKYKNVLSIRTKLLLLSNIANGLRFLNSNKIVHMDLAPKNILVSAGLLTKIIDFGEAYCDAVCLKNYQPGFTIPYGPPQVFTQKIFTTKQDSFSFGMIFFKLLFNRHPFQVTQKLRQSYKDKSYCNKIFLAVQSLNYQWLETPMLLLLSLFIRCKDPDPLNRPYPTWMRIILKIILQWYKMIYYE